MTLALVDAIRPTPLRYFEFDQNNAGGRYWFDAERGISVRVFIQAASAVEANRRALAIGINFDDQCKSCCGYRWWELGSDAPGRDRPEVYGVPVEDYVPDRPRREIKGPHVYVHRLDGSIEGYGVPRQAALGAQRTRALPR
ncbi:hypothetical protein [Saccharothrix sp. HUAS TT1]|uniref:DUF7296 family protein n=1 Tax=unclassified Saccharothrix TaxID=2593673 RepID=UPI00345C0C64